VSSLVTIQNLNNSIQERDYESWDHLLGLIIQKRAMIAARGAPT
jgi:hypothetical protein